MLLKDIVPLKYINKVKGIQADPNTMMIERFPIIPIEPWAIYYNGIDADVLKGLTHLQSL